MNTTKQKVTGEGNALREINPDGALTEVFPSVLQSAEDERRDKAAQRTVSMIERATGRTIWNSDGSEPCLICGPSHEDIARMAGLPFDGTVEAIEAETDDDDTRTLGLPADEQESDEERAERQELEDVETDNLMNRLGEREY